MKSGSVVSLPVTFLTLAAPAYQQDQDHALSLPTETRDSAGIRIVENARPPAGSRLGWRIGPEPAVSIGVLEGEDRYMLQQVTDADRGIPRKGTPHHLATLPSRKSPRRKSCWSAGGPCVCWATKGPGAD